MNLKVWQYALILLLISILLCFVRLGDFPIYILDEAKNATCAREMWEQNNWVVPTYNYELRTDKPPLHYYFMMLAYQCFGVSPFSARFFSALLGISTVLITFFYVKKWVAAALAFWVGLILLASLHWNFQFHLSVPDPYLIACLTLAFFAFFTGIEHRSPRQLYLGYIAVALATLSKGIVAIGLVGLVILLYLIWSKKFTVRELSQLRLISGGLLFLAIALPWYILVGYATNGAWLEGFFFQHNFGRFSSEMEGHGGIFLITFAYVVVGMLPFSIFLPQTLRWAWSATSNPLVRFSSLVVLVIVGFFSVSATKLPNYTVPAYPFLAILLACFLYQNDFTALKKYRIGWNLAIWCVLTLVLNYFVQTNASLFVPHTTWTVFVFFLFTIGAIIAGWAYWRTWNRTMFYALSVSAMLTTLSAFYWLLPTIFYHNSIEQSLEYLPSRSSVAHFRRMHPAFPFYIQKPIPKLETQAEIVQFFEQYPDGRLLTFEKYLPDLEVFAPNLDTLWMQEDLFENTKTVILKKGF